MLKQLGYFAKTFKYVIANHQRVTSLHYSTIKRPPTSYKWWAGQPCLMIPEETQNPSTLVNMKTDVHPQNIKRYIIGLDPSTSTSNNIALSGNGVCPLNDHFNGDNENNNNNILNMMMDNSKNWWGIWWTIMIILIMLYYVDGLLIEWLYLMITVIMMIIGFW